MGPLGLSWAAWAVILGAVWLVTATAAALLLARMIQVGQARDREHAERVLAENELRKLRATPPPLPQPTGAPPVYTGPRGRHHPDTSQLPAQPRADLAEAVSTGPLPQVPGAWTEEIHPARRATDNGRPSPPLPPGQPGGRRRSDERQTRSQARALRNGEDPAAP